MHSRLPDYNSLQKLGAANTTSTGKPVEEMAALFERNRKPDGEDRKSN